MAIWLREILGSILMLMGLFVWLLCLGMLDRAELIQAGFAFFMGLTLFKAGVHFMKLGLAVRLLRDVGLGRRNKRGAELDS